LSDVLVVVLGLVAGAGLVAAVLGWQREALVRRRVEVLERSQEARRRSVVALADLAAGRWEGDTISVRGTMPVRDH
jgi:Flp pilus assembly protein TadB